MRMVEGEGEEERDREESGTERWAQQYRRLFIQKISGRIFTIGRSLVEQ